MPPARVTHDAPSSVLAYVALVSEVFSQRRLPQLGTFASGLVIYWVANNLITFTQQYTIMRTQGVKPNVLGNIFGAFKRTRKAE